MDRKEKAQEIANEVRSFVDELDAELRDPLYTALNRLVDMADGGEGDVERVIDYENLSEEDEAYLTREWVETAERAKAGDRETIEELLYLVQAHALDPNHPMAID